MSTQIKQRIIGGLVLLALLAIFLPLFFSNPHPSATLSKHPPGVPQKPQVQLQLPKLASAPSDEDALPSASQTLAQAADLATPSIAPAPASDAKVVKLAVTESAQPQAKPTKPAVAAAQSSQTAMTTVKPKVMAAKPAAVVAKPAHKAFKALVNSKAWVVQLGSFGHQDNAKRLVKKLRQSGYQAYSRHITTSAGKSIYQVFVGPEINRQRIESLQQQLNKHYRMKGLIKRYRV